MNSATRSDDKGRANSFEKLAQEDITDHTTSKQRIDGQISQSTTTTDDTRCETRRLSECKEGTELQDDVYDYPEYQKPLSRARCIALVVTLTGASFLNASTPPRMI